MATPPKWITTLAIEVIQNGQKLYLCALTAKTISTVARVNMREPEEDRGYQRLFVDSHITGIKKYFDSGKCIPVSMLLTVRRQHL